MSDGAVVKRACERPCPAQPRVLLLRKISEQETQARGTSSTLFSTPLRYLYGTVPVPTFSNPSPSTSGSRRQRRAAIFADSGEDQPANSVSDSCAYAPPPPNQSCSTGCSTH